MKTTVAAALLASALSIAGSAKADDTQAQSPSAPSQSDPPAGANGGAQPLTPKMQGQSSANGGPASGNTSGQTQTLGQDTLRQQLQQQLSDAGYTFIKIMPSSFYVQA